MTLSVFLSVGAALTVAAWAADEWLNHRITPRNAVLSVALAFVVGLVIAGVILSHGESIDPNYGQHM